MPIQKHFGQLIQDRCQVWMQTAGLATTPPQLAEPHDPAAKRPEKSSNRLKKYFFSARNMASYE
jgi:hypothetical protein